MNTKTNPPEVKASIEIKIDGKIIKLTETDAKALFYGLKAALNIADPAPYYPPPIYIDRYVDRFVPTPATPFPTIPNPYITWCSNSDTIS